MVSPLFRRKGTPLHKFPSQLLDGQSSASVPGSEYHWGLHANVLGNAETLKSHIWASVTAATVVASVLGAFVSSVPQAYANVQPQLFKSTQGAVPPVIQSLQAAPQVVDLSVQASFFKPLTTGQGAVPPIQVTAPQGENKQFSSIWSPIQATVVTPNPIASFFTTQGQFEERASKQIFPNQVSGQVTPVIPFITGGPQRFDLTQQGSILPIAAVTTVIILGPTVSPVPPVPPQFDVTVNGSILWTQSTFSPSGPVVDAGVPAPIGHPAVYYVKGKRKKSRDLESSQDVIREVWTKVVAEVTAPVPKAGGTVQPAAKVILPLIAAAPVKPVSLASLSAELAEVQAKVELLEDEEELITILAIGGYI